MKIYASRRFPVHLVVLSVIMFLLYIYLFSGNLSLILRLGREDGPVESLGALCFLAASVLLCIRYFLMSDGLQLRFLKTRRNPIIIALAALFFIFAGEEISWGQRIFHITTPEFFAKLNGQKEINIHNLYFFLNYNAEGYRKNPPLVNSGRIFMLFSGGYLLLVPLLTKNKRISVWLSRLNFPVAPLFTGVFFCLNYGMFKVSRAYFVRAYPAYPQWLYLTEESRESFMAILFLVVAWTILRQAQKTKAEKVRVPELSSKRLISPTTLQSPPMRELNKEITPDVSPHGQSGARPAESDSDS